jgi:23S rRNA (uracil1939-C5)-methyltransferase
MDSSSLNVTLKQMTYGGETLGRLPDGRAVFVPFTLPGETVRVRPVLEKRGFVRAELLEVLEPSPERIQPKCAHYQVCGGCHYQHLGYPAQLQAKADILKDQLVRIGKLEDPPVRPTVASPQPFGYRNTVQFHLNPQGRLGYKAQGTDQVVAIQECHLMEAELNQTWPLLDFEALPEIERVGLRLGADGEIQMILESPELEAPEFSVSELPLSAVHLSPAGTLVLAGSDRLVMEVNDRLFQVSAGSFFQVNTAMAGRLVKGLLEGLERYASLGPAATLLDIYCGVGLFSAFLAPNCGRLIGVEASPSAVEDFGVNLDEFEHVELYEAEAELALPVVKVQAPEAVVVDPPREGLGRLVLDSLLEMRPQVLAYISCDPATLARDAQRLANGGYRLQEITPYDLFPQTYHIESLSFWKVPV